MHFVPRNLPLHGTLTNQSTTSTAFVTMPSSSLSEDPRRPEAITRLPKENINSDDIPPSLYGMASMFLGMAGLLMRYKLAAWLALFACMANIANMRTVEWDTRQVIMNLVISLMGLFTCYFTPEGQSGLASLLGQSSGSASSGGS